MLKPLGCDVHCVVSKGICARLVNSGPLLSVLAPATWCTFAHLCVHVHKLHFCACVEGQLPSFSCLELSLYSVRDHHPQDPGRSPVSISDL